MAHESRFAFPLTNMVLLITGAASGIGRATTLMALSAGAKVAAVDIADSGLASLEAEAREYGSAVFVDVMDVTDRVSIEQSLRRAKKSLGLINGLVCSAGTAAEKPFVEINQELWDQIIRLNLTGTFLVAQAIARDMVLQNTSGSIVTISSALGVSGRAKGAHYSASKAGVIALTKSMALELAANRIRVNCVAPGGVETPLMQRVLDAIPGGRERGLSQIPLGRFGLPEEVASTVCFLLSDLSAWTTGQTLHVNGGSLLS